MNLSLFPAKRRCLRKIRDKCAVTLLQNPFPTPNKLHFKEFLTGSFFTFFSPDGFFLLMDCPAACEAPVKCLLFQEAWKFNFLMAALFSFCQLLLAGALSIVKYHDAREQFSNK